MIENDSLHDVVIIGAGSDGLALLEVLLEERELVRVVAVVDDAKSAPAIPLAREHGVAVHDRLEQVLRATRPSLAFNVTGSDKVQQAASEMLGDSPVIGGMPVTLMLRIINNMKEARQALSLQASNDPLTGLYSRRHMMGLLQQGLAQAVRYQHPCALVMIDLDHCKRINDMYGHAAGDKALVHVAELLKQRARQADVAARWGGEEFLVLLPHTSLSGAHQAVEQWLGHLQASPLRLASGTISLGFSAGVSAFDGGERMHVDALINRLLHIADGRMHLAKEGGRNRVVSDGEVPDVLSPHDRG